MLLKLSWRMGVSFSHFIWTHETTLWDCFRHCLVFKTFVLLSTWCIGAILKKHYNCRESRGLTTVKPYHPQPNGTRARATHTHHLAHSRATSWNIAVTTVTICAHKTEPHMISGTCMQSYWKMQLCVTLVLLGFRCTRNYCASLIEGLSWCTVYRHTHRVTSASTDDNDSFFILFFFSMGGL